MMTHTATVWPVEYCERAKAAAYTLIPNGCAGSRAHAPKARLCGRISLGCLEDCAAQR